MVRLSPSPTVVSSKTWKSDAQQEREHFERILTQLKCLFPQSPFVPRDYPAWIHHRTAMLHMKIETTKKDIEALRVQPVTSSSRPIKSPSYDHCSYSSQGGIWGPEIPGKPSLNGLDAQRLGSLDRRYHDQNGRLIAVKGCRSPSSLPSEPQRESGRGTITGHGMALEDQGHMLVGSNLIAEMELS